MLLVSNKSINGNLNKTMLLSALCSIILAISTSINSFAISSIQAGANAAKVEGQPLDLFGATGVFTTISNLMLFMVGTLSVIMLIFGGLRYIISGGNSSAVTSAKNTVLYAIVGLVVALLAFAIVNFVLGTLINGVGVGGTNV